MPSTLSDSVAQECSLGSPFCILSRVLERVELKEQLDNRAILQVVGRLPQLFSSQPEQGLAGHLLGCHARRQSG